MSALRAAVTVAAPAKLNLYLHVTAKRADGYHALDSLMTFARLHDTLVVELADSLELTVGGPFGPALAGEDNLVLRAARALAERAGVEPRARIHLIKRLPVAAGIGGGSADAAAALRALSALWELDEAAIDMPGLALSLGADVPVCLAGRAASVSGAGEVLGSAPALPNAALVLVNPGVPLSTPRIFQAREGAFSPPNPLEDDAPNAHALAEALRLRRNDLEAPASVLAPVVGEVKHALEKMPGALLARMSGSGATCFAIMENDEVATAAAGAIAALHPDWWVRPSALLHQIDELVPMTEAE